jgi:hypothetical protein
MNHQQYKEWLMLLAYGELDSGQKKRMEEHLRDCSDCAEQFEQIKKLNRVVENHSTRGPSEDLLREARQELRAALRIERNRKTLGMKLREWFSVGSVSGYRAAIGFAAMLVIGILLGFLVASRPDHPEIALSDTESKQGIQKASGKEGLAGMDSDVVISNIRFLDADTSDGQVEFAFDAVRPMRVKGSVDDKKVQEILTYALVKEQNPGVRLRAVNTIGAYTENLTDSEVKKALITALMTDDNDGVRKEALTVLKSMPFDKEIQAAMIYVLSRDQNAALRIEAIKSLEGKKIEDESTISVLRERMESDENSYIRRRAKAVLEEVTEQ